MIQRREFLKLAAAAAATAALPPVASAQAFPSRPIRYIVPWTAGGSTDIVMRAFAERAGKTLGQTVLVENKPGVTGTLGATELAKSRPDGYALAQLPISVFRIPHMQKVQFDTLNDFTWIICLTGYTFGLVVRSDSSIKSLKDLIDYARANPDRFSYASPGTGSSPHVVMEQLSQRAEVKLLHIPFKGVADGMQALLGGHVMSLTDSTAWAPHVDAGTFRLLATCGSKRTKRWSNVATLSELGYPIVMDSPFGVCGPKGMDSTVVKTLHDAFRNALDDPAVQATLDKYDQPVIYLGAADYTRYARETFIAEKATIERIGLANKGA